MVGPPSLIYCQRAHIDKKHYDAPHPSRVPLHDFQICADSCCKIDLIYHKQVAPSYTRSTFTRYLVPSSNVNHIYYKVCELARVVGSKVVAARLDEEEVSRKLAVEVLQLQQIRTNVFPHSSMWAATRLNGGDARRGESSVFGKKFGVLTRGRDGLLEMHWRSVGLEL